MRQTTFGPPTLANLSCYFARGFGDASSSFRFTSERLQEPLLQYFSRSSTTPHKRVSATCQVNRAHMYGLHGPSRWRTTEPIWTSMEVLTGFIEASMMTNRPAEGKVQGSTKTHSNMASRNQHCCSNTYPRTQDVRGITHAINTTVTSNGGASRSTRAS